MSDGESANQGANAAPVLTPLVRRIMQSANQLVGGIGANGLHCAAVAPSACYASAQALARAVASAVEETGSWSLDSVASFAALLRLEAARLIADAMDLITLAGSCPPPLASHSGTSFAKVGFFWRHCCNGLQVGWIVEQCDSRLSMTAPLPFEKSGDGRAKLSEDFTPGERVEIWCLIRCAIIILLLIRQAEINNQYEYGDECTWDTHGRFAVMRPGKN